MSLTYDGVTNGTATFDVTLKLAGDKDGNHITAELARRPLPGRPAIGRHRAGPATLEGPMTVTGRVSAVGTFEPANTSTDEHPRSGRQRAQRIDVRHDAVDGIACGVERPAPRRCRPRSARWRLSQLAVVVAACSGSGDIAPEPAPLDRRWPCPRRDRPRWCGCRGRSVTPTTACRCRTSNSTISLAASISESSGAHVHRVGSVTATCPAALRVERLGAGHPRSRRCRAATAMASTPAVARRSMSTSSSGPAVTGAWLLHRARRSLRHRSETLRRRPR